MPKFSEESVARLDTAHPSLQRLFAEVINQIDCTIICAHRSQADQNAAFASGHSKDPWPNSKHDSLPARAVDAMPYPLDWQNIGKISFFAGLVLGTAYKMGIKIRWGGHFETLKDYDHFELMDDESIEFLS